MADDFDVSLFSKNECLTKRSKLLFPLKYFVQLFCLGLLTCDCDFARPFGRSIQHSLFCYVHEVQVRVSFYIERGSIILTDDGGKVCEREMVAASVAQLLID